MNSMVLAALSVLDPITIDPAAVNRYQWVDICILIIMVFAVIVGITQGFFRSIFSLGGLILGLAIAEWNYTLVAAPLNAMLHDERISSIIGFILIAVLVMAVCGVIGVALHKMFKSIGLGCLDRLAGGVFGFFQGMLLVTVAILVTVAFYPQAEWLTNARLPRHFFAACHLATHMSPDQLSSRTRSGLRTLEAQTPDWMHPRQTKP
jgi:membrane protein required for colicin V production